MFDFLHGVIWPLPIVFWPIPYALAFWAVFLWIYLSERIIVQRGRAVVEEGRSLDAGSFTVIVFVSRFARIASVVVAFIVAPWSLGADRVLTYGIGLLLMIAGSLLRRYCFSLLGKSFTGAVAVPVNRAIVDRGIYGYVRHPSYTGGILHFIGIGVCMTNWWSVAIMVIGAGIIYIYRVTVEERALLASLGAPYADYMRRTKRFVPFIF